ncbi:unnamed protein product [Adineta ricciae]|uniref:Death domain-containing protein n=1 Tax=Adineta ricciae TaxID=249248 RepID=A0A815KH23_ADIRI|nr:unnamed protein product [Adineta ricciae]
MLAPYSRFQVELNELYLVASSNGSTDPKKQTIVWTMENLTTPLDRARRVLLGTLIGSKLLREANIQSDSTGTYLIRIENERRAQLEEEQRLKELEIRKQNEQERLTAAAVAKAQQQMEEDYSNYIIRDFMRDERSPQCLVRLPPTLSSSTTFHVTFLNVVQTENLLDNQEELVSTPIQIDYESTSDNQKPILFSIPYVVKRSIHRENVIKIRQPNGIWLSVESNESSFDAYKEKRFMECKLTHSTACAVVSRLRIDTVLINQQSSGRFVSSADPRIILQWPKNVSHTNLRLNLRVQPVDQSVFTQFSDNFSEECQGLLAVGPIIDLDCDDVTLLKPMQFKLPILVQTKKNDGILRSTGMDSNIPQRANTSQLSQQELILQQQQSIFKSMLGEESSNERLLLLYSGRNENTWHIDTNVSIFDSKTHDMIAMDMQCLHPRIVVARCDRQLPTNKQLQTVINLFEQSLNQRTVSCILRRRASTPNEICFVCCSNQRINIIDDELQQENYTIDSEQVKELTLQEGQLLELRFRGNVLPVDYHQQSYPFAFNTQFPFYHTADVCQTDKYCQHFSPYFYGFVQIFSKQKVLRTVPKENDKKKQQTEVEHRHHNRSSFYNNTFFFLHFKAKQEWHEVDVCLVELPIRLPKAHEETRLISAKTSTTFVAEGTEFVFSTFSQIPHTSIGILTPALFRDIAVNLHGDEWRTLGRRLGITRIRIEAIEHDHRDEAAYYMLVTWFKRVSRSADKVVLLINGLTNINRWDLAQDLQAIRDERRQAQKISSKDEQLTLFRAPFNRICQREECTTRWKEIARALDLTNDDIQHIEESCLSREERCLRSLEYWLSHNNQADILTLARTLRSLSFKSLAREIDSMA